MLYYKDNKYHLSKLKVHYKDKHEGEVIKHVGSEGKEWWIKLAERWKDTFELIDIFEIEEDYTKEQYKRLDKVNELRLPEGIMYVEEYVLENSFENIKRNHPLYILKLEEENEKLKQTDVTNKFALLQFDNKILQLERKLNEFSK